VRPADLDRYGCTLGARRITYDALRHYVCEACGGAITHRIVRADDRTVDRVACAACGGEDIISEQRYQQQVAEGYEVLRSLPPEFRALYVEETDEPPVDAKRAIADLWG